MVDATLLVNRRKEEMMMGQERLKGLNSEVISILCCLFVFLSEMGVAVSTHGRRDQVIDDTLSRRALQSIENYDALGFDFEEMSPPRRRRKLMSDGVRKGRLGNGRDEDRPSGAIDIWGPVGHRWPISGVAVDVLIAEGNIVIDETNNEAPIVRWTLDIAEYRSRLDSLPRLVSSRPFKIESIGTRLLWRLSIVPKDYDDSSISLYLESVNSCTGEPFVIQTRFSMAIGAISKSNENCHSTDDLGHCFSSKAPVWGLPSLITFTELSSYLKTTNDILLVTAQFTWIRDGCLFPPRFITLPPSLYLISESPKIFLMENILTKDECEDLIKEATPHLYRSRVSVGTETPSRTSSSMFFTAKFQKSRVVHTVNSKLLQFISRPEIHDNRQLVPNESLQVVRYKIGEFYAEHYDTRSGQSHLRAATVIVYLRDTPAGGATFFPRATGVTSHAERLPLTAIDSAENGVRIYPRRGRGIFFWSRLPNGEDDRHSLHAAEPILLGEKWIATRWLRELD